MNSLQNDPRAFDLLPEERKEILLTWIGENIIPRQAFNLDHSSYGLKHLIQYTQGEYFTNGEFKGAMLHKGYKPKDPGALNWQFAISEKSPGIVEHLNNLS